MRHFGNPSPRVVQAKRETNWLLPSALIVSGSIVVAGFWFGIQLAKQHPIETFTGLVALALTGCFVLLAYPHKVERHLDD